MFWPNRPSSVFIVAPCMLIILSFLFVQLMHTILTKLLKSFTIITVAPTCFALHKPSSGSSQPVLHQSYNVDISYIYRYFLKLSVLWLHILFSPVMHAWIMRCAEWNSSTLHSAQSTRITGLNKICSHSTDNFK